MSQSTAQRSRKEGQSGGRLLAAVGGLVFALVLLEVGLRVAAFFEVRAARQRLRSEGGEARPLIAFVGDSNIYGVYVEEEQTLPKAVERLSRRGGSPGVRCLNLGIPGAASWDALEQTRQALRMRPRAVVVTVGVNNYQVVPPGEGLGVVEGLRLVKAVRLALFNWRVRHLQRNPEALRVLPGGPGGKPLEGGELRNGVTSSVVIIKPRDGDPIPFEKTWRRAAAFEEIAARLKADLIEMSLLAERAGCRLVVATYLAGLEEPFAGIRDLALSLQGQHGIVVADTAAILPRAIQGDEPEPPSAGTPQTLRGRRSLFLFQNHPTALGYEMEARVVARTLHDIGVLPDIEPEDPLAPLAGVDIRPPR